MGRKRILMWALVVGGVLVIAAGVTVRQYRAGAFPFASRAAAGTYTCPMHPYYTSDRPGECPICGMDLVPVKDIHAGHTSAVPGMAAVELDTRQQQLIGLMTTPVERRVVTRTVRAVGTVVPDERRVYAVNSKVSGWVERLYVNSTGQPVSAGQPLLAIYSPEVFATQEEYRLARERAAASGDGAGREKASVTGSLVDAAARRLTYWDISPDDIERVGAAGETKKALKIRSPYSGYVLTKNAELGMRVEPGMPLYTIADLSRVWVEADVYEYELPFVRVGQPVTITLSYYPAEPIAGTVKFVYPFLDEMTRTARVRVEVPNVGLRLKPQMFANVSISYDLGEQLVVPASAVYDTGDRKIVFVAHGAGHFEPRPITVTTKADDYYVVAAGLREGERVVTSGNFLLDSESRIRGALTGAPAGAGHQH